MTLLQGEPLQGMVQQIKAPISRASLDEKVEVFERRLNGKILPFLGLHGTLLALVYLIAETPAVESLALRHPLLPVLTLTAAALFCGLLTTTHHFFDRPLEIDGGAAVAFCLGLMAVLLLPLDGMPAARLAAAVTLCMALLALNAAGRVAGYEFNTVWLYLPLIFFVVGRLSGLEQMLAAVALYGPAIYVKFGLQPKSSKVPLGLSVLIFLSMIVKANADSKGLIAAMVLLVLVLFVIYGFRMRHLTGSSYRHFLADAIIVGLWTLLVGLMGFGERSSIMIWGAGIAAYQSIALLPLLSRKAASGGLDARDLTERDARLAWLQIATVALLGQVLAESVLEARFGIDRSYVAVLIIIAPFIPLFRWLQAPFLALTTRLFVGGCLIAAAWVNGNSLKPYEITVVEGPTSDMLQVSFSNNWESEYVWATFALALALAATMRITRAFDVAWWRGMIRPRHMVLLRRAWRLVVANAGRIAFVGGLISAAAALFSWIRYAGGNSGGQRSRDLLLVGAHVYAVAITVPFIRYAVDCCNVEALPVLTAAPLAFADGDLAFVLACCLWGILLYLRGVLAHDYLARFFATAFVVTPLASFTINNSIENSAFLAQTALVCCFALFGFGLFRRLAG